jgi:hypothetical protein
MPAGRPIYLDYNSTTPIDPAVLKAMLPYLGDHYGNPSCTHLYGREAHTAVERAREQVAELVGATADEIVFTGGGSEASNHAIKGAVLRPETDWGRNAHVIISAVEHPATAQPCEFLKELGCEVTVVPVENEFGLRNLAWIEDNRRKVDQMSKGRLAYVYLPNTSDAGYTNFNRYYFAQTGREGAVIDERFNGGGAAADYIVDYMARHVMNFFTTRYGEDFSTPTAGVFGPKAMIVNEFAGSGGDLMPWLFRQMKLGPLVGKRTWGGLVGIFGFPALIDGGRVTAPNLAFYNLNGEWEIENHGVAPDVEVEMDPAAWSEGRDPQLEKAVQVVLAELDKNPKPQVRKPAYPNYHK